jgi:hypothetical protein
MKVRISWESRKALFRYPLGPEPRTAVLGPWFRETADVRIFPRGWTAEAESFAPEAIAATWPQLRELARNNSVSPTRALIVVARPGSALLSNANREALWRVFHVPVFEQIIGARGKLLAAECEAHDGLHIEVEGVIAVGFALDGRTCACGRKTPRLTPSRPVERARAVAAYAR